MDVTVTPMGKGEAWQLSDLLGRELGRIEHSNGLFYVQPAERGLKALAAVGGGFHRTLEDAISAIEKHTHAVCRLFANNAANDR